jgi:DNA-binding IclR family transcriptional regulator
MPRKRTKFHPPSNERSAVGLVAAPSGVKSASRVLQIFELFDEVRLPLKVGEIAEKLDYPQSSTSVLLRSLVGTGYVDYDPATRSYLPTARVGLLGSWCIGGPFRTTAIAQLVDQLSRVTGQTVVLAGRNGIYAQYIHVVQATQPLRMHVPIGALRPLVWSTAGFVLMRDYEESEIRTLVRRTNAEAVAPQRPIAVADVLGRIEQARKQGYGFSRALVTPGTGMICVPLPGTESDSRHPLAICVSGWVETMERDETAIVRLIREAIVACMPADAMRA